MIRNFLCRNHLDSREFSRLSPMMRNLCNQALDILFPPACLACEEPLLKNALLCPSCLSYLSLLIPEGRCRRCFESPAPHDCQREGLARQAFCFDASPITEALRKKGLTKLLVSYLLVQLTSLAWDVDYITALPLHPLRRLSTDALQDTLLAQKISEQLKIPYQPFLRSISDETLTLKKSPTFSGETLLFVGFYKSDLTGQAVRLLKDAGPCRILGLYISKKIY